MKERPILFSAPMVRAILDGSKTQTRRVMKPQPQLGEHSNLGHEGEPWWAWILWPLDNRREQAFYWKDGTATIVGIVDLCPHGKPGDRLWVKETHGFHFLDEISCTQPPAVYAADGPKPATVVCWRPSIHMPRWASRILLEVISVDVERVQAASRADILAEGVRLPTNAENGKLLLDVSTRNGPAAFLSRDQMTDVDALLRAHWAALWCEVNGRESWDANPWVWVIEFKRVQP